jgi:hypothetical protein
MGFDDRTTYITDRTGSTRSRRSGRSRAGLGAVATAGAASAGLAAMRHRSRSRDRTVLSSRPDSRSRVESRFTATDSYLSDEKYAGNKKTGTWKDRLLGAGAAAGGIFAFKSLFNRNKKHHAPTETGSDVSYDRPLGPSEVTQTDLSRLEEGRAPASPSNRDEWRRVEEREAAQAAAMAGSPLRQGTRPPRSGASMDSFDSRTSFSDEHDDRPGRSYGLKEGVATLGVLGFLKHSFGKRKNKKEDERAEALRQHDLEEERIARSNSGRRKYTGDGGRRHRPVSTDYTESDITGMTPMPRPPMESTIGPSTAPIRPPPHADVLSDSGSEAYNSPSARPHRRHKEPGSLLGPALASGAAAGAISTGSPSKRDNSQRRSSREGSVASPPVSVKVKMHNDGRHVTLRRLNEEEAAAEREARKERQKKNRTGSRSSISDLGNERWRRTEALEAQQAQEMGQGSLPPPPPMGGAPLRMPEPSIPGPPPGPPPGNYPGPAQSSLSPPPPMPAAMNSVLSSPPGTQVYGTETDLSGAYDSNRRRRRAERAQAKAARSGGSRVEFS